jgi:TatD DNase family protein
MGFYISFSGIVTFRNAELLREAARYVPLDRLLVETERVRSRSEEAAILR